jgi:hypothetical protein
MTHGRTDDRTDRRTDGSKTLYLHNFVAWGIIKGAVWGLSAQIGRASGEYDVLSVLFDVTMQSLHGKKLTLSLSQRKDTSFFLFF